MIRSIDWKRLISTIDWYINTIDWLIEMIGWLIETIDWLIRSLEWLKIIDWYHRLIDTIDWMVENDLLPIDWSAERTVRFVGLLSSLFLFIDGLSDDQLVWFIDWLIDYLNKCSNDRVIDWMLDRLNGWLIDLSIDSIQFHSLQLKS